MTALVPANQASLRWNSIGPSLLRARTRVPTCGTIKAIVRRRSRVAMTGTHRLRVATTATRRLREVNRLVIVRRHVQGHDTVLHRALIVAVHHRVAEVKEVVEVRDAAVMNQGPLAPSSVSFVRQRSSLLPFGVRRTEKGNPKSGSPFSDFSIKALAKPEKLLLAHLCPTILLRYPNMN